MHKNKNERWVTFAFLYLMADGRMKRSSFGGFLVKSWGRKFDNQLFVLYSISTPSRETGIPLP